MNKKWQIYEVDEEKVEKLSQKYNLNKLLSTILVNRNIVNEEDIRLFLKPTRNDFHNPFLITDMEIAIKRIIEAIDKKERVTIYGDGLIFSLFLCFLLGFIIYCFADLLLTTPIISSFFLLLEYQSFSIFVLFI